MIVNARMYSATPAVKEAWKTLLRWVMQRAKLDWELLDYDAPAPLAELWKRTDLGLAMMCGLPYSQRKPRPVLVAAPVPAPERYGRRPVYFTDLAVRADAPYRRLEDTFGGVVGYTLEDSMSGFVAFRNHLDKYRKDGKALYARAVGGFVNARQIIDALAAGKIDVGPLDSYYYDLLRRNDPEFAARVRVVATTEATPIPPMVATARVELGPLRAALAEAGTVAQLAPQRELLLLKGFAVPRGADYKVFNTFLAVSNQYEGVW